jgi:DNA-binding NarL/FixJ family response regulator
VDTSVEKVSDVSGVTDCRSVFLLDDHRVFTDMLELTLGLQADMRCVAVTHSLGEALEVAARTCFDVAVVDLQLPDGDGMTAIPRLRALRPDARIIVLTAHPRGDLAERALAGGAVAFLPKDGTLSAILAAIRTADATHPLVGAGLRPGAGPVPRLTRREHDVLRGLARGQDAHRIAGTLGISPHTTRDHIKALLAKLDSHTQLEAVVTACRLGMVELDGPY